MQINKNKLGLVIGSYAAIVHLVWVILVALGLAQPLINFIVRLHFIDFPHKIASFDFVNAILLIVIAFIAGYIGGYIIGTIWNKVYDSSY